MLRNKCNTVERKNQGGDGDMKKILKTVGIILLVIIALIAVGLFLLSKVPSAPKDYTKTVETGGEIETRYMNKGSYKVKHFTAEADEVLVKHLVYYPADLESSDQKYPVIFSLNGTGIAGSKYTAVFEHFASCGFIGPVPSIYLFLACIKLASVIKFVVLHFSLSVINGLISFIISYSN